MMSWDNTYCFALDCVVFMHLTFRFLTNIALVFQSLQCPICHRTSSCTSNLRRHLLMHQGKYRYNCEHCSKGFASKKDMLEHLTIHTNEWYFSCEQCGEKFKNSYRLKIHKQKAHKGGTVSRQVEETEPDFDADGSVQSDQYPLNLST